MNRLAQVFRPVVTNPQKPAATPESKPVLEPVAPITSMLDIPSVVEKQARARWEADSELYKHLTRELPVDHSAREFKSVRHLRTSLAEPAPQNAKDKILRLAGLNDPKTLAAAASAFLGAMYLTAGIAFPDLALSALAAPTLILGSILAYNGGMKALVATTNLGIGVGKNVTDRLAIWQLYKLINDAAARGDVHLDEAILKKIADAPSAIGDAAIMLAAPRHAILVASILRSDIEREKRLLPQILDHRLVNQRSAVLILRGSTNPDAIKFLLRELSKPEHRGKHKESYAKHYDIIASLAGHKDPVAVQALLSTITREHEGENALGPYAFQVLFRDGDPSIMARALTYWAQSRYSAKESLATNRKNLFPFNPDQNIRDKYNWQSACLLALRDSSEATREATQFMVLDLLEGATFDEASLKLIKTDKEVAKTLLDIVKNPKIPASNSVYQAILKLLSATGDAGIKIQMLSHILTKPNMVASLLEGVTFDEGSRALLKTNTEVAKTLLDIIKNPEVPVSNSVHQAILKLLFATGDAGIKTQMLSHILTKPNDETSLLILSDEYRALIRQIPDWEKICIDVLRTGDIFSGNRVLQLVKDSDRADVLDALAEQVANWDHPNIYAIVEALHGTKNPLAVRNLTDILRHCPDRVLRRHVLKALSGTDDHNATLAIAHNLYLMYHDRDREELRPAAKQALLASPLPIAREILEQYRNEPGRDSPY